MTNPVVDLIGDRTGRIVPIYPQSEKAALNTWEIAGWVEDALRECAPVASPTRSAGRCRERLGLIGRQRGAVRRSTCPRRWPRRSEARRRLAFDELLRVQTRAGACASGRWSASPRASATRVDGDARGRASAPRCRTS